MTDFEKAVAQAAIAANPAPLGSSLTQNVVEKTDLVGIVEQVLTKLVDEKVLVCESTMPQSGGGTWGSAPFGSQTWGATAPPQFFKYTKGEKWEEG
jgi:hypothetical protein